MKALWLTFAVLLGANALLFAFGPAGRPPPPPGALRVGLVFDVGGRGDKSFNDSAYNGLVRAERELGVAIEVIEPGEGADRESALRMFAARGFDLVIATGFIFTDDVNAVAADYPSVRFACVDYALRTDAAGRLIPPPTNVAALKFREEEGAFLVGALAALTSESGRLGFVGGMDIPLIRRFQAGYAHGVRHVCPACKVVVNYAGVTGGAFKDPGRGKELALAQYRGGVDIIFHASGATGLGVFEAARQTRRMAIGVDSDQYAEAPGFVLTSMVKRVDEVVYRTIGDVQAGRFASGIRSFGLAEDGVTFVDDRNNAALIAAATRARLAALRAAIVAQEIRVDGAESY